MPTDIVSVGGATLSFVDLILIGVVYATTNKRLNALEKSGVSSSSSSIGNAGTIQTGKDLETRVLKLENTIEVLLQRLNCYDELFSKILVKLRDDHSSRVNALPSSNRSYDHSTAPNVSPARMTSVRSRHDDSLLTRKDPFVDSDSMCMEKSVEEEIDENRYSFLKDE